MDILLLVEQILILFLMIGVGYFLMKIKMIDHSFNQKLNTLVLNLTLPCLIISSVFSETDAKPSSILNVLFFSCFMFVALPFIAYLVVKLIPIAPEKRNLYQFMLIYSNNGFIGIPIIMVIYGNAGVIYSSIIVMLFNLSVFTYGIYLFTKDKKEGFLFDWRSLISPGVLSSLAALFLYFFQLSVPSAIIQVFQYLGDMTTPLAMILVGASLTSISFKEIFTDWSLYPFVFIKQVLLPIVAIPLVRHFVTNSIAQGVIILCLAMPVANIAVMFASQYKSDASTASKGILLTTLLSLLTLPLIASLL
ncbi:MAG: AEC family transporter [Lactovum sp.]